MKIEDYITNDTEQQSVRWLQNAAALAREKPHLQLSGSTCALLVVDMNRYFTHPDGTGYLPSANAAALQIQSLLAHWRRNGWRTAFARHGHNANEQGGMFQKFFRSVIAADSPEADIIDTLAPTPEEPVFSKNSYDAFLHTGLAQWLDENALTQVLICGVLTHMCVESTARAAFCRGYEVYIPVDAVAADNERNHEHSLQSMAQTVAVLHTTRQILDMKGIR